MAWEVAKPTAGPRRGLDEESHIPKVPVVPSSQLGGKSQDRDAGRLPGRASLGKQIAELFGVQLGGKRGPSMSTATSLGCPCGTRSARGLDFQQDFQTPRQTGHCSSQPGPPRDPSASMGPETAAPWVSVPAATAFFIPGARCPLFWLQGQGCAALISARPCSNDKPASNCSSIRHRKFSVRHGKSSWAAAVESVGYPVPKFPLAAVPALPGPAEQGHLAPAETWGYKFLLLYPLLGRQSSASPSTPARLSRIQHAGLCTASRELGFCFTGLEPGEFASHGEGAAPASLPHASCHLHRRGSAARARSPPLHQLLHRRLGGGETEARTFSTSFSVTE